MPMRFSLETGQEPEISDARRISLSGRFDSSPLSEQNKFVGMYDPTDAAMGLRALEIEPAWHEGPVAFGGAPIWTDDTKNWVVSGEVRLANAKRLQKDLGLVATSDLALLGELYARQGLDGLRSAMGMFVAAFWDRRNQELTLVRDHVGARTLYYSHRGQCWTFGAKAFNISNTPVKSGEISLTALRNYLTCAYVPGQETMLRDVLKLRPGMALRLPQGRIVNYWEPMEGTWSSKDTLRDHAARLRSLLEVTVGECLPTDEPVGVFLSGGIDSSLVTALTARLATKPVHTFSIHFGKEYPNELEFSDLVARHCKTEHHVLELSACRIEECLDATMRDLDDPIGDPLTVPNYLLGAMAKEYTDYILNGEGGDPIFGGPKNAPMLLHGLYPGGGTGLSREQAYFHSYHKCYEELSELLTADVQAELARSEPQEALLTPFFENPAMAHYLNKLFLLNIRLKGADHILTKVNNLTTANELVGLSPLFDPRVVDLSFSIPPEFKLHGAVEKAVLKAAAADLLPERIINRPKSGMLVPVQSWFRKDLKKYAESMLLQKDSRIRPYIETRLIKEWLTLRGNLLPRHGVKLWLLLSLEVWLRARE